MKTLGVLVCALGMFNGVALAQQVQSFADLEIILDDQIVIEDFEGISLHGGGTIDVPNPLNTVTLDALPFSWAIQDGITYTSPDRLAMHAGFLGGDEDVYLRAFDGVEIEFDAGQVAFGMNLIGFSTTSFYTVAVYDRNGVLIESFEKPSNSGSFMGYQAPLRGISRVVITHSLFDFLSINNVAFGAEFVACPADVNGDGVHNFFDVGDFIGFYLDEDDRADYTDDGQFNFFDVAAFLDAYLVSCP